MQSPAECCPEGPCLLLGSAVAAILRPAHPAAAPRPRPPTDRQRHTVDDENGTRREQGGENAAQRAPDGIAQPMGEGVEAAVEARRSRAGRRGNPRRAGCGGRA